MPRPTSPISILRRNRFVWLGTKKRFDAFTFAFEKTDTGWFQAHRLSLRRRHLDLIVEAPEDVLARRGVSPT